MPTSALFGLCVLIWGTTWFAITAQIAVFASELGVAVRFGLAALLLAAMCRWRGIRLRYGRRAYALFLAQGLNAFCAGYVCVYAAERFVVSGVVAVGYAASPLFGLVLTRLFLGTPMSTRVAAGAAVGVLGVGLIFGHELARLAVSREAAWGVELTLASVLLSSLGSVAAAGYQRLGVKGWGPLAWAMGYGALAAALWAAVDGTPWRWAWTPAFVGTLLYLVVFGTIVAFGAYVALIGRVGPARAGYVGVATPVVALVVSSALEGFAWTGETVAGIVLAIAGNVIALWPREWPEPITA